MKHGVPLSRSIAIGFFIGAVALVIIDRAWLIGHHGARYTGSDEAVMWAMAHDMSQGLFREPFFYGQDYGPALEAVFAVPMLWAGVPVYWAMPIATSLLALAPFISFALWFAVREQWASAGLVAVMPLLLPVEWEALTTMSRGFVNGIAVLALLPMVWGIAVHRLRFLLVGSVTSLAVVVNPNALLCAIPLLIAAVLRSDRPRHAAAWSIVGALPPVLAGWAAHAWCSRHPEMMVHRLEADQLVFSFDRVLSAWSTWDDRTEWLCPVWWSNGVFVCVLIAMVALMLVRQRKPVEGSALGLVLLLLLVSFGFRKTADGSSHLTYALSRMNLALPLVLAWGAAQLSVMSRAKRFAVLAPLLLGSATAAVKWHHGADVLREEMASSEPTPVPAVRVSDLLDRASGVLRAHQANGIDLVVVFRDRMDHTATALVYAGEGLYPGMPATLFIGEDRRSWRRQAELVTVRSKILFLGLPKGSQMPIGAPGIRSERLDIGGAPALLVTGNTLQTDDLLAACGWPPI